MAPQSRKRRAAPEQADAPLQAATQPGVARVDQVVLTPKPNWWNKPEEKLKDSEKAKKEDILRKDALKLRSCMHPLADAAHHAPPSTVRPTQYTVPTPVTKEELDFVAHERKPKAATYRAPPPPCKEIKHFPMRRQGHSMRDTEVGMLKRSCDKRIKLFAQTAKTIVVNVNRDALASRDRTPSFLAVAEAKVAEMQNDSTKFAPIHTSTVVRDSSPNKEPLVFYYACDPVLFDKKREELRAAGVQASDDDINDLLREAPSTVHGLDTRALLQFCERTQDVMAFYVPPVKDPDQSSRHRARGLDEDARGGESDVDVVYSDRDSEDEEGGMVQGKKIKTPRPPGKVPRKKKDAEITEEEKEYARIVHKYSYMEYDLEEGLRRETFGMADQLKAIVGNGAVVPDELFDRFKENIAVLHFVHCWHENGKRTTNHMTPSSDMHGDKSSTRLAVARTYHTQTRFVRSWIERCFRASVPAEDYTKYEETYKAGRIFGDEVPGPFLAQVVVWKCDLRTHRDAMDGHGAWCLTFCGGNFEGGIIYFPDLELCFRYKPGDILIFRSADLYHCVGPWKPTPMKRTDTITPGRMAFVFFSPHHSMRVLDGKRPNWFIDTAGGHFEEKIEVMPRKKRRVGD